MPSPTYTLIASNTVSGSSTATVEFTSIPNTYTDLVVKFSIRGDYSGAGDISIYFNADNVTANKSGTRLTGSGSAAASSRTSSATTIVIPNGEVNTSQTANTFTNGEIYIPSYTVSQQKPISVNTTQENNATSSGMTSAAGLRGGTSAISRVSVASSGAFAANSTFYLYGIKNS